MGFSQWAWTFSGMASAPPSVPSLCRREGATSAAARGTLDSPGDSLMEERRGERAVQRRGCSTVTHCIRRSNSSSSPAAPLLSAALCATTATKRRHRRADDARTPAMRGEECRGEDGSQLTENASRTSTHLLSEPGGALRIEATERGGQSDPGVDWVGNSLGSGQGSAAPGKAA